jgi:hypothetical protein
MPRAFLTPFVIVGLLFLPSCSSAGEPKVNSSEQAKSECEEVKKTYDDFSQQLKKSQNGSDGYRLVFLIQQHYLLEKQECFTSLQIATAKASIDLVIAKLKP